MLYKGSVYLFVLMLSCCFFTGISEAEKQKKTYSQKEIEEIEKQAEKQLDNKTSKVNPQGTTNKITVKPEDNTTKTLADNAAKTAVKLQDNITRIQIKPQDNVTKISTGDNTTKLTVKPHDNVTRTQLRLHDNVTKTVVATHDNITRITIKTLDNATDVKRDNSSKTPVQTVSVEDLGVDLDDETAEVKGLHSTLLAFATQPDEPASLYPELKHGKLTYGILSVLSPEDNDNTTNLSHLKAPLPYSNFKKESTTVLELISKTASEIEGAGVYTKSRITRPYVLFEGVDFPLCPADGGTLYGVFIGVQKYKMDNSMVNTFSKSDALDFQNIISSLCKNTVSFVFIDDNATIGWIYENLADIKQKAAKKDSFLFYYSGFSSVRDSVGYMFLTDTINDKVLLRNTSLDFNSLYDFSRSLRVSNIMFFIDTVALVREIPVVQPQQQ
ncbi:MAG: hypothetical protein H7844_10725 [Nitrospirae bacterium YQR-1]